MNKRFALSVVLLCFVFVTGLAFAEGGAGSSESFDISTISLQDGDVLESGTFTIEMTFTKNVNNIKVSENNKTCFSITNEAGEKMPADVVMYDDQLDSSKKNNITINCTDLPNGKYTLTISEALQAKNGSTLAAPLVYNFTVGKAAEPAAVETENTGTGNSMLVWGILAVVVIAAVIVFCVVKKKK